MLENHICITHPLARLSQGGQPAGGPGAGPGGGGGGRPLGGGRAGATAAALGLGRRRRVTPGLGHVGAHVAAGGMPAHARTHTRTNARTAQPCHPFPPSVLKREERGDREDAGPMRRSVCWRLPRGSSRGKGAEAGWGTCLGGDRARRRLHATRGMAHPALLPTSACAGDAAAAVLWLFVSFTIVAV